MLPEILWNVTELKEGKRIYEKAFIGYHNKYRNHEGGCHEENGLVMGF